MRDLLGKVILLVGQDRRWRWGVLVAIALCVTGIEALGALLVYSILGLIAAPDAAPELPAVGSVEHLLPGAEHSTLVLVLAAAAAVFFAIRGLAIIGAAYVQHRMVNHAAAQIATDLVRGYLALPYAHLTRRNSSELIRNTFQAVQSVMDMTLTPLVTIGAESILILGLLVVLLAFAPAATGLAVVVLVPLVVLLLKVVQPRLKHLGWRRQDAHRESLKVVQQSLSGIREIRVHGREHYFAQTFQNSRLELARAQYLHAAIGEFPRALIETAMVLVITLVFIIALLAGEGAGAILSALGLFAYAGLRIQPSLRKAVRALNDIRYGAAALDDLVADVERIRPLLAAADKPLDQTIGPLRDRITLQGVAFTYDKTRTPVVRDVDLVIRRGESIGICGPTGGGKSTLVDLLVGLLQPDEGRVLIDGVDIREDLPGWFRQLGLVSQSVFLIDDTLRRNIAFGLPDAEIDEKRIRAAVSRAQLTQVVADLPQGLDTLIGERGVRLSGGQRQRLAIARELYAEPEVLVFDEGTSALDGATEASLMSAIEEMGKGRTFIAVAHRLATVRNADRILVVSEGRVVDQGTYDELVERSELFQALAR